MRQGFLRHSFSFSKKGAFQSWLLAWFFFIVFLCFVVLMIIMHLSNASVTNMLTHPYLILIPVIWNAQHSQFSLGSQQIFIGCWLYVKHCAIISRLYTFVHTNIILKDSFFFLKRNWKLKEFVLHLFLVSSTYHPVTTVLSIRRNV